MAREPWGSPYGGLLRRRGLFNQRSLDVGLFTLLTGLVQEPVDYVSALLFLDPSFLRFRLFGEELCSLFPSTLNPPSVMELGQYSEVVPGSGTVWPLRTERT
jgi:hypothetical protein